MLHVALNLIFFYHKDEFKLFINRQSCTKAAGIQKNGCILASIVRSAPWTELVWEDGISTFFGFIWKKNDKPIFIYLTKSSPIQQMSIKLVFGWIDKAPQNMFIFINPVFIIAHSREHQQTYWFSHFKNSFYLFSQMTTLHLFNFFSWFDSFLQQLLTYCISKRADLWHGVQVLDYHSKAPCDKWGFWGVSLKSQRTVSGKLALSSQI